MQHKIMKSLTLISYGPGGSIILKMAKLSDTGKVIAELFVFITAFLIGCPELSVIYNLKPKN